jgi:2-polyprenyl-3-methyl-5-hydroxy-6-metoxy-1,4-benzoquinol methylase
MRLGLTTWNPLVWTLDRLGLLPTPLMVGFWGMESSRALIAALELGLFDELGARPRTAAELAADLRYDDVGVEALLNALNGFGYLRRRDGVFSLRRSTKRWLTSNARFSMVRPFGLFAVLWGEMDDVEERVRSGGARDFHRPDRDADFWRRYEIGLGEAARLSAPTIAKRVRLQRQPERLLDVGGGHGTFSAAFCRRYRGLHATVLDLPGAVAVGRELVAEQGLSDRIEHREADFLTDGWGDGYDVVLIFNVLHLLTPEQATATLARAFAALTPGGTLAVLDSVHRSDRRGNIDSVGGGSELLFYIINGTRSYPEETMLEWIEGAGFEQVRRGRLLAIPEALISARRPRVG